MPNLDDFRIHLDSTYDDPSEDPDRTEPVFLAGTADDITETQRSRIDLDNIENETGKVISIRERFESAFSPHARPKTKYA